jgi:hypothetical protein
MLSQSIMNTFYCHLIEENITALYFSLGEHKLKT